MEALWVRVLLVLLVIIGTCFYVFLKLGELFGIPVGLEFGNQFSKLFVFNSVQFESQLAETNNDLAAAQAKMEAKGANILYLNNVSNGAIFGASDTEGFIITSNGAQIQVPRTSKDTLAELLLDQALSQLG